MDNQRILFVLLVVGSLGYAAFSVVSSKYVLFKRWIDVTTDDRLHYS